MGGLPRKEERGEGKKVFSAVVDVEKVGREEPTLRYPFLSRFTHYMIFVPIITLS